MKLAKVKPRERWENKSKDNSKKPKTASSTPQGDYKRMRGFGG